MQAKWNSEDDFLKKAHSDSELFIGITAVTLERTSEECSQSLRYLKNVKGQVTYIKPVVDPSTSHLSNETPRPTKKRRLKWPPEEPEGQKPDGLRCTKCGVSHHKSWLIRLLVFL